MGSKAKDVCDEEAKSGMHSNDPLTRAKSTAADWVSTSDGDAQWDEDGITVKV